MNYFCFTLEGSNDNLYEPPYSRPVSHDFTPTWQRSPPPLRWRGSDPCLYPDQTVPRKAHRRTENRRSHVPTSTLDIGQPENTEHLYWTPSPDKKDSLTGQSIHNKEPWESPCHSAVLSEDERIAHLELERREKDPLTQGVNFEAWNPNYDPSESQQEDLERWQSVSDQKGTLKKIQKLVRLKKDGLTGLEEGKSFSDGHLAERVLREGSAVIACIGQSKKTEKTHLKFEPSSPRQQARDSHWRTGERPRSSVVHDHQWRTTEVPPPWDPYYHRCHRSVARHCVEDGSDILLPQPADWVHNGVDYILPPATDWQWFETRSQELDSRESGLKAPRFIQSSCNLHLSESMSAEGPRAMAEGVGTTRRKKKSHSTCKRVGSLKYITGEEVAIPEGEDGQLLSRGCRRSSNSLESLHSLNSGQSSSSGVTSGSDGSSNRNSFRLEEESSFLGQFCCRARVNTDFEPSAYDTESLRLKVGDVIEVISKPPNGIWTGMLRNKVGTFKFIYVDVLPEREAATPQRTRGRTREREGALTQKTRERTRERESAQTERLRGQDRNQKSRPQTVQELMDHLDLEDYSCSLPLNGYQSVGDLTKLRGHHLVELDGTDPEDRHLLTAVDCLQEPSVEHYTSEKGEAKQHPGFPKTDINSNVNSNARDSGCFIPSDCSTISKEDSDVQTSAV